ncbi:MAG: transcriptional repressor LexA [Betaproteobacteria bacterium]|nr:transcriptional repressor LexA [Betaproteobacteria bacterium]
MEKLTERQQEVLDFLQHWIAEYGMPPTRQEISRALGFRSANSAEEHLRVLARKGFIEMLPGSSRGIRIVPPEAAANDDEFSLPLVGRVAAGQPILAQENFSGRYPISPLLFKPKADYLLQVVGMSMKDIGIMEGDWLAVHKTSQVRNGQIVVARVEGDVTVKRLKLKGNRAYLIAENPDFLPIVVDMAQTPLDIEGLVVGVIRAFDRH